MISYLGLAFVVGWISCQSYYGLTNLWAQKNQLAQAAAQAVCDRGKARDAAGKLIASDGNDQDIAQAGQELRGCGKVSPDKVPQVAKILKQK